MEVFDESSPQSCTSISASPDQSFGDKESDVIPEVEEQNSALLGDDCVLPSLVPTGRRRRRVSRRTQTASSEQLSSELSRRLRDASTILLDRLFDYLSKCPAPSDEPSSSTTPKQQNAQRGLTLPASAIGWLSLHLYPDVEELYEDERDGGEDEFHDWWMEVPTRDRLPLIRFLLPRATHLRVTSDEWPPPPPTSKLKRKKKRKKSLNKTLANAVREEDTVHQPFLNYFYMLRHCPKVDMQVFPNLSVLLLDGIPPEWITNLDVVRNKLELIRMERGCICSMTSFLFPEISLDRLKNDDSTVERNGVVLSPDSKCLEIYRNLTHLKLSHCALGELSGLTGQQLDHTISLHDDQTLSEDNASSDLSFPPTRKGFSPPPLSLLQNLVSLSLANNDIVRTSSALAGLSSLPFLSKLDLSFNHLSRMDDAFLMLGNLKVLLLSGNRIQSSRGLDRLYSLEHLSLDRNRIQDFADIAGLSQLPDLSMLDLYGNKFAEEKPEKYRVDVLNSFRENRFSSLSRVATYRHLLQILPVLDGKCATNKELLALRYFTFIPSSSSPIHGGDPFTTSPKEENKEETKGEDGRLSVPLESALMEPDKDSLFSAKTRKQETGDTVALATPQTRVRRITRITKTRRAVIGDDYSGNSGMYVETTTKGSTVGRTNFSMYFQENHAKARSDIASDKTDFSPTLRKVKFSVQDMISSLPTKSPALHFDELVDEDSTQSPHGENNSDIEHSDAKIATQSPNGENSSDIEHSGAKIADVDVGLSHASETSSNNEAPGTKVNCDASAEISPQNDSYSTAATSLSLFPLSTVKPGENSTNGYARREDSVSAEEEQANFEAEDGVASGANEQSDSQDFVSLPASPPTPMKELDKIFDEHIKAKDAETNNDNLSNLRDGSSVVTPKSTKSSQDDENVGELVLKQASFPEHIWDDDLSLPSSLGASRDGPTGLKFKTAEETSLYDGPESYRSLNVLVNLELYFRCFVFPSSGATFRQPWCSEGDEDDESAAVLRAMPRIQLCSADREARKSDASKSREGFRHVWSEEVVACGKPAGSRLAPNRTPRRGFHGDIMFAQGKLATVSECRKLIFCSSDAALYLISDYDSVTSQSPKKLKKRQFPMPIPQDALFENAPWPHAVARHEIRNLQRITIGFGFQRLTLHFAAAEGARDFVYVLLTANKLTTVSLLQQLQDHMKDALSTVMTEVVDDSIVIDNDDKHFLDALAAAVAPAAIGVVMHYQILQQRWKHGDRGSVRRACVVTDTRLCLLDEDYVGDGSSGSHEFDGNAGLGDVSLKVVESAELNQIVEVLAADADPRSITIVVRPSSRLKRTHRWRLLCRDGAGAERLVEDVRKATSFL